MGTTARMKLPYPERTNPPDVAAFRALAEAVDPHLSRVYEAVVTFPAVTNLAVGASPTAQVVTFPAGRFTTPPVLFLQQQSLPSGAQWLRVLCSTVSTTQASVYAYNTFTAPLTTNGTYQVAVLAIQRDG